MDFDQWKEQYPYSWHPGMAHAKEKHGQWLQLYLLTVTVLQQFPMPEIKQIQAALEAELPSGFMQPFDEVVYQQYFLVRDEADRKRVSNAIWLELDKMSVDAAQALWKDVGSRLSKKARNARIVGPDYHA